MAGSPRHTDFQTGGCTGKGSFFEQHRFFGIARNIVQSVYSFDILFLNKLPADSGALTGFLRRLKNQVYIPGKLFLLFIQDKRQSRQNTAVPVVPAEMSRFPIMRAHGIHIRPECHRRHFRPGGFRIHEEITAPILCLQRSILLKKCHQAGFCFDFLP